MTAPVSTRFAADDADDLCRQFMDAVAGEGRRRLFQDAPMHEVWGLSGTLRDPRSRLFTSAIHPEAFNPALAVARWFYLLSGSDRLADITAYSPAAARFTDDGITMPGGSHGARLFHPMAGVDQVERAVATLADLGETTGAVLALHHPTDQVTTTADFICVTSALVTIRDGRVHGMLHMRSNEAFRLLWYDLFEFTMLTEYIAARLGLGLGCYVHSGFVFQITGDADRDRAAAVAAETARSPAMSPMPRIETGDRAIIVGLERRMREAAAHAEDSRFEALMRDVPDNVDLYWADLLCAAALQARLMATPSERRAAVVDRLAAWQPGEVSRYCHAFTADLLARG